MKDAPPSPDLEHLAALFRAGRYADLEKAARGLLKRHRKSGAVWKALGVALQMQGADALAALRKAAKRLPEDADAHYNLGNALQMAGRHSEATTAYARALQLAPNDAEIHANRGAALHALGQYREAQASHRRALEIAPEDGETHYNLANTLAALNQHHAAVESYRRAVILAPLHAAAQHNLGNTLRELGQIEAAIAAYRRALQIAPDYAEAQSGLLFACNLLPDFPPAAMLAEARRYGELAARHAQPRRIWPNKPKPRRRLRIGLVSGDLRRHPVGYFLENVLAALTGSRLKFFAYANFSGGDELSERLRATCHRWREVAQMSDARLAEKIAEDRIDILIDLAGHTAANRLPLFAWKPAPVQVTWLGYFATSGVAAIDYLLADPWTLPVSEEAGYTEKIRRLPETRMCFSAPDEDIPVAPLPALANGHVTFGCFNNLAKMTPAVVALWARILKAAPDSRLFLKSHQLDDPQERRATRQRYAAHGIASERLILEGQSSRAEYLAAYQRVDIALDPFPYAGATVSAESLWMGAPVLTLAGRRLVSRQSVGLLQNAGLPEWIAGDPDDYLAKAIRHSTDLPRLAALRSSLRQQVLTSPIFDAARFARHFEEALRGMWVEWCEQEK